LWLCIWLGDSKSRLNTASFQFTSKSRRCSKSLGQKYGRLVNRSSRFCLSCIGLVEILALFGAILSKPVLAMGYAMVFLNVCKSVVLYQNDLMQGIIYPSHRGIYPLKLLTPFPKPSPTGGVKFLHVP